MKLPLVILVTLSSAWAFAPLSPHQSIGIQHQQRSPVESSSLSMSSSDTDDAADTSSSTSTSTSTSTTIKPQVWSTGFSPKADLLEAIQEATDIALEGLPKSYAGEQNVQIDLAVVTISSLYDGQTSPSVVVPAVLSSAATYGTGIQKLVGCTTGGIISSRRNDEYGSMAGSDEGDAAKSATIGIESEGLPGVSIVLAILPDVQLKTFHVLGDDVPDDVGRVPDVTWKRAVGLNGFLDDADPDDVANKPAFFLIPAPSFQNELDDFLQGLAYKFPGSTTFGGIASTVSSLSRARLFQYDASDSQSASLYADGCIGVGMAGDIQVKTMVAQGTKPVGGIYRVVAGEGSTIKAIVLDENATQEAQDAEEEEEEEEEGDDNESTDKNAIMAAAYAKAAIPKPPLAEANFIMRTLSDDDRAFMSRAILVGLERGGSMGRTPNELLRLAEGKGHRFTVTQVASAGMKDGSVTLPLGSVKVEPGMRVRFFVRESDFSKKEVQALWTGYKKKTLEETMNRMMAASKSEDDSAPPAKPFEPAVCLLMSTLDRGSKFFGGKPGYESSKISEFVPSMPCIGGFCSNGAIAQLDGSDDATGNAEAMVHGSASTYVLIGSASRRPIFSAAQTAAAAALEEKEAQEALEAEQEVDAARPTSGSTSSAVQEERAPRSEDGELILKRREVHSGRALTVSTVEWSVAENMATPTSTLEGYMWDKETEVDRFRERVPLSNLVSQCRMSSVDLTMVKPRDWIGPVLRKIEQDGFVIIPECKQAEPLTGSLRKRYDVAKLVKKFVTAGAPAVAVNCDGVLFGGCLEDLTTAREASAKVSLELATEEGMEVPPILASDLILYPYQLYKMRLAGTDAVNLMGGALAGKDLLYLTKIAASLQIQVMMTVTTAVQIESLLKLSKGSVQGLIVSNRNLEDFSFDLTGQQALDLLQSSALEKFREHYGADVPVFVEGRVGIIERSANDGIMSSQNYLDELKAAGAVGAFIGGGLALETSDGTTSLLRREA